MPPFRLAFVLLALAAPAGAATLPEALNHWTGTTPDVVGAGEQVRIVLPPGSPVPGFTARAVPATEQGEAGWRLTEIALPNPLPLQRGLSLTAAGQHATAWLGGLRAHLDAQFQALAARDHAPRGTLASLTIALAATQSGSVRLDASADGLTLPHTAADLQALLPRHATLHGRSTQGGIEALVALLGGGAATTPAPLTVEKLEFDSGPAHISGSGSVTLRSPQDRVGRLQLQVTGFDALMRALPHDGPGARLFAPLLLLRGMARPGGADGQALVWVVEFNGRQMLIDGLDLGPLLGL